jgi:hypothetical protein
MLQGRSLKSLYTDDTTADCKAPHASGGLKDVPALWCCVGHTVWHTARGGGTRALLPTAGVPGLLTSQ